MARASRRSGLSRGSLGSEYSGFMTVKGGGLPPPFIQRSYFIAPGAQQDIEVSAACSAQAPIIFGEPDMRRAQTSEGVTSLLLPGTVLDLLSTTRGGADCKPVAARFGSAL